FTTEIAEAAYAQRPEIVRVARGERLVVVGVVLTIRAGGAKALPVHDHERDIAAAPRRDAHHDAALVGEVCASIADADAIRLIVLVRQAKLALEERIGNLELTDYRADAATADVGELHVSVLQSADFAALRQQEVHVIADAVGQHATRQQL